MPRRDRWWAIRSRSFMPLAAPSPCRHRGCGALSTTPYCSKHKVSIDACRYRGSASSRGYDSAWQRIRKQALIRDHYLCVMCLAEQPSRATPAQDVDHVLSIEVAPELRLDLDNLQSLCRPCHRIKTQHDRSHRSVVAT